MSRRGKRKKTQQQMVVVRGRMILYGRPDPDRRPYWLIVMAAWDVDEREFWLYVTDWKDYLRRCATHDRVAGTYWGGAIFRVWVK